jgi:hypothetical protein
VAISKAQQEVDNASKSSTNPHFKSKYADLAEVINTVRLVFNLKGVGIIQSTGFDGAMVNVTTVFTHIQGGYITSIASCVPSKTDAQGIGAATTYLRRYSLAAMAGIAQEDDDGNAAAHNTPPAAPVRHTRPKDDPLEKIDLISATDLNTVVDTAITVGGLPEDWKEKVIEHYKVATFEDLNEKQYQGIVKSLKEKGIAVS